jgi:hypothetical protein
MTTTMNTAMSATSSAEYGWPLIITGAVLAVVGLAMVWASGPRHGRWPTRRASSRGRLSIALVCAAITGGLITGVQWAVLSQTRPAAWVAVLGPPALLAGAAVTRLLLLILGASRSRRRKTQSIRHGRSER